LAESIDDAGTTGSSEARAARVVTVASGKGGVGKTNVSINLAIASAMRGRRVLLLDADLGRANVDVLLNLKVRFNIADVLAGRCEIGDVVLPGPGGIRIIPAASGVQRMATLDAMESTGVIHAFSELTEDIDLMIVDVAAGIHSSVTTFSMAADEVLVVVCDEPGSMADAYALIKVLCRDHGIRRFRVLANMVRNSNHAKLLYRKIARVAEEYLDVVLRYAGHVPQDEFLRRALRRREAVVAAYPDAGASLAFKKLAESADNWTEGSRVPGSLGFFFERSLGSGAGLLEAD